MAEPSEPQSAPTSPSGRLGLVQQGGRRIGRQITLPWSKAFEISIKSVQVRFWRSLITAAGIVLAIAFLMATLTRNDVLNSLKNDLEPQMTIERQKLSTEKLQKLQQMSAVAAEAARKRDEEWAARNPDKKADDLRAKSMAKVAEAAKAAEIQRAGSLLEKAIEDRSDLLALPDVAAFRAEMLPVMKTLERMAKLNEMRLTLIKQGETPKQAGSASQAQELSEARARDYWLMILALLVALVGITNSMLMSVTERFREIGTMKCLGALDSFVVKLFLIESTMQGFLGTLLGVLLGLVLAFTKVLYDYGWTSLGFIPWSLLGFSVLLSLVCGTGLAVGGALYPAYVAAKMEPAVAMRVDQ